MQEKLTEVIKDFKAKTTRNFLPAELNERVTEFLKFDESHDFEKTVNAMREKNKVSSYSQVNQTLDEVSQVISLNERYNLSKGPDQISFVDKNILSERHSEKIFSKLKQVLYSED